MTWRGRLCLVGIEDAPHQAHTARTRASGPSLKSYRGEQFGGIADIYSRTFIRHKMAGRMGGGSMQPQILIVGCGLLGCCWVLGRRMIAFARLGQPEPEQGRQHPWTAAVHGKQSVLTHTACHDDPIDSSEKAPTSRRARASSSPTSAPACRSSQPSPRRLVRAAQTSSLWTQEGKRPSRTMARPS